MKRLNWLDVGGETAVRTDSIIGIFDIDNTTVSVRTREFLAAEEGRGRVENLASDIPVSFVVTDQKTFLSQYSPRAIKNRDIFGD